MINERNLNRASAAIYTIASLAVAGVFLLATLFGDYDWVARLGGAAWVFALVMVILMPTVPAIVRARVAGEPMQMPAHDHDAMLREQASARATVKDPVCGMDVEPATAAGRSEHGGKAYYFCNRDCRQKFDANPEQFARRA